MTNRLQRIQQQNAFVVEGDANDWWDPTRDLDVSKVLFDERVPVAIRRTGGDEYEMDNNNNNNNNNNGDDDEEDEEDENVEICSVRVSTSATTTTTRSRILRVHVQSEKNPFFSHSMEVNEEEFNVRLKREQNIRVDFNQFPTHFIDLLRECLAGTTTDDEDEDNESDGLVDREEKDKDTNEAENALFRRTRNGLRKSQKVKRSTDGKKNAFFAVLTLRKEKKSKTRLGRAIEKIISRAHVRRERGPKHVPKNS
jgi:hypothetical protein